MAENASLLNGLNVENLQELLNSKELYSIVFEKTSDTDFISKESKNIEQLKSVYEEGLNVVYNAMNLLVSSDMSFAKDMPDPLPHGSTKGSIPDIDDSNLKFLESAVGTLKIDDVGIKFLVPGEVEKTISNFEMLRKARLQAEKNLKIGMKDSVHVKYGPEEIFREFVHILSSTTYSSSFHLATTNEIEEIMNAEKDTAKDDEIDEEVGESTRGSHVPLYAIYEKYPYRTKQQIAQRAIIVSSFNDVKNKLKTLGPSDSNESTETKNARSELNKQQKNLEKAMVRWKKNNEVDKPSIDSIRTKVRQSAAKSFDSKIVEGKFREHSKANDYDQEEKEYNNSDQTWNIFPKVVYSITSQGFSYNQTSKNTNDKFHEEIVTWFDVPEFITHKSQETSPEFEDWEIPVDISKGIAKFRPDPVTRTWVYQQCQKAVLEYNSDVHINLLYYAVRGMNLSAIKQLVLGLDLETLKSMIIHEEFFQASKINVLGLLEEMAKADENYRDIEGEDQRKEEDDESDEDDEYDDEEDEGEEDEGEEDEEGEEGAGEEEQKIKESKQKKENKTREHRDEELKYSFNDTSKEYKEDGTLNISSRYNPLFSTLRDPVLRSIIEIVSLISNGTETNLWRNKVRLEILSHEITLDGDQDLFVDFLGEKLEKHLNIAEKTMSIEEFSSIVSKSLLLFSKKIAKRGLSEKKIFTAHLLSGFVSIIQKNPKDNQKKPISFTSAQIETLIHSKLSQLLSYDKEPEYRKSEVWVDAKEWMESHFGDVHDKLFGSPNGDPIEKVEWSFNEVLEIIKDSFTKEERPEHAKAYLSNTKTFFDFFGDVMTKNDGISDNIRSLYAEYEEHKLFKKLCDETACLKTLRSIFFNFYLWTKIDSVDQYNESTNVAMDTSYVSDEIDPDVFKLFGENRDHYLAKGHFDYEVEHFRDLCKDVFKKGGKRDVPHKDILEPLTGRVNTDPWALIDHLTREDFTKPDSVFNLDLCIRLLMNYLFHRNKFEKLRCSPPSRFYKEKIATVEHKDEEDEEDEEDDRKKQQEVWELSQQTERTAAFLNHYMELICQTDSAEFMRMHLAYNGSKLEFIRSVKFPNPEWVLKGGNFYVIENVRSLLALWKDAKEYTETYADTLFNSDLGQIRALHTFHSDFSYYLQDTHSTVSTLSSSAVAMVGMAHSPWNSGTYLEQKDKPTLLKDFIKTAYSEGSLTRVDILRMKEQLKKDTAADLSNKWEELRVFFAVSQTDEKKWITRERNSRESLRSTIEHLLSEPSNIRFNENGYNRDIIELSKVFFGARSAVAKKRVVTANIEKEYEKADDIQEGLDEQHNNAMTISFLIRKYEETMIRCIDLAYKAKEFAEKSSFRSPGSDLHITKVQRRIDGFLDFHLNLLLVSHYMDKLMTYSKHFNTENLALSTDFEEAYLSGYDDFFKIFLGTHEEREDRSAIIDVGWIANKIEKEYEKPVFLEDRLKIEDVGGSTPDGVGTSLTWRSLNEWTNNAGNFFCLWLVVKDVFESTEKERESKEKTLIGMTGKLAGKVNIGNYMICHSYLQKRGLQSDVAGFVKQTIENKVFEGIGANQIKVTKELIQEINREYPHKDLPVKKFTNDSASTFNFKYVPLPSSLKTKEIFTEHHVLGMMLILEQMKTYFDLDKVWKKVVDYCTTFANSMNVNQRELIDYFLTLPKFVRATESAFRAQKETDNMFLELLVFACAKHFKGAIGNIAKSKQKSDWQGLVWVMKKFESELPKDVAELGEKHSGAGKILDKKFDFESTKANIWFTLFQNARFLELKTLSDWFIKTKTPGPAIRLTQLHKEIKTGLGGHHQNIFENICTFLSEGKRIPLLTELGSDIALQSVFYPILSDKGDRDTLILTSDDRLSNFFGGTFKSNTVEHSEFTYTGKEYDLIANLVFDGDGENDKDSDSFKRLVSIFAQINKPLMTTRNDENTLFFGDGNKIPEFVDLFSHFCILIKQFVDEVREEALGVDLATPEPEINPPKTKKSKSERDLKPVVTLIKLSTEEENKEMIQKKEQRAAKKLIGILWPIKRFADLSRDNGIDVNKIRTGRFEFLWNFALACMNKWAGIYNSFAKWSWEESIKKDSLAFGLEMKSVTPLEFKVHPKVASYVKQMMEEFNLVAAQELRFKTRKTLLQLPNMLYQRVALSEGSVIEQIRETSLVNAVILLTKAIVFEVTATYKNGPGCLNEFQLIRIETCVNRIANLYRALGRDDQDKISHDSGGIIKVLDEISSVINASTSSYDIKLGNPGHMKWQALYYMAREMGTTNINMETIMELRRILIRNSHGIIGGSYSTCDLNQLEELFRCYQGIFSVSQSKSRLSAFLFFYYCNVVMNGSKSGLFGNITNQDGLFDSTTSNNPGVKLMKTLTDTIACRLPPNGMNYERVYPTGDTIDLSEMADIMWGKLENSTDPFEVFCAKEFEKLILNFMKHDRFLALSFCAYIMNMWTSSISELINGLRKDEKNSDKGDDEPERPEDLFSDMKNEQTCALDKCWEQLRYLPLVVDTCLVVIQQYFKGIEKVGSDCHGDKTREVFHFLEDEVLSHFILDYNRLAGHRNRANSVILSYRTYKSDMITDGILRSIFGEEYESLFLFMEDNIEKSFALEGLKSKNSGSQKKGVFRNFVTVKLKILIDGLAEEMGKLKQESATEKFKNDQKKYKDQLARYTEEIRTVKEDLKTCESEDKKKKLEDKLEKRKTDTKEVSEKIEKQKKLKELIEWHAKAIDKIRNFIGYAIPYITDATLFATSVRSRIHRILEVLDVDSELEGLKEKFKQAKEDQKRITELTQRKNDLEKTKEECAHLIASGTLSTFIERAKSIMKKLTDNKLKLAQTWKTDKAIEKIDGNITFLETFDSPGTLFLALATHIRPEVWKSDNFFPTKNTTTLSDPTKSPYLNTVLLQDTAYDEFLKQNKKQQQRANQKNEAMKLQIRRKDNPVPMDYSNPQEDAQEEVVEEEEEEEFKFPTQVILPRCPSTAQILKLQTNDGDLKLMDIPYPQVKVRECIHNLVMSEIAITREDSQISNKKDLSELVTLFTNDLQANETEKDKANVTALLNEMRSATLSDARELITTFNEYDTGLNLTRLINALTNSSAEQSRTVLDYTKDLLLLEKVPRDYRTSMCYRETIRILRGIVSIHTTLTPKINSGIDIDVPKKTILKFNQSRELSERAWHIEKLYTCGVDLVSKTFKNSRDSMSRLFESEFNRVKMVEEKKENAEANKAKAKAKAKGKEPVEGPNS